MKLRLFMIGLVMAGCTPMKPPPSSAPMGGDVVPPAVAAVAEVPVEAEAEVNFRDDQTVHIDPAHAPTEGAGTPTEGARIETFQIRREKGITRYPYDGSPVTVRCQILRVCDLELQAGETITETMRGDAERWWAIPTLSGTTPHIGVKPLFPKIRTNLMVYTNRRTYEFLLIEGGKPESRVGFWYPADEQAERVRVIAQIQKQRQQQATVVQRTYDNHYTWSGDEQFAPTAVVNDGTRTYLTMGEGARHTPLPTLYDTSGKGDRLINYTVQWPNFVVGSVLQEAALVHGVGWGQQRVEIRRGNP